MMIIRKLGAVGWEWGTGRSRGRDPFFLFLTSPARSMKVWDKTMQYTASPLSNVIATSSDSVNNICVNVLDNLEPCYILAINM